MLNTSPVLNTQDEMVVTYLEILHDKMRLLTSALAISGKAHRAQGYDPLVGALTQLSIVARRISTEFDPQAFKKAVEAADDRWWEWFDKYRPKGLIVPPSDMNYSPRREERMEIREQLKAKYGLKVETPL